MIQTKIIRTGTPLAIVRAGLMRFSQVLAAPTPFLQIIGPKLVQWQQENIDRGSSPLYGPPEGHQGEPFKPLSPVTVQRKGHAKPLIDTSDMMAMMVFELQGAAEVIGGATALSEKGYPYPEAHQLGHGVPVRAWSGLRQENVQEEASDLYLFVFKALEEAFRG